MTNLPFHPARRFVTRVYNKERYFSSFLSWVDEFLSLDDRFSDQTEDIASATVSKVRFLHSHYNEAEYSGHQRKKLMETAQVGKASRYHTETVFDRIIISEAHQKAFS